MSRLCLRLCAGKFRTLLVKMRQRNGREISVSLSLAVWPWITQLIYADLILIILYTLQFIWMIFKIPLSFFTFLGFSEILGKARREMIDIQPFFDTMLTAGLTAQGLLWLSFL